MKTLVRDRSNSWATGRCRQRGRQRTSGQALARAPPDEIAFTTENGETDSQSITTRPKAAVSNGNETART
ncbi:hypothetical protein [Natrinema ejinorense]|nr:hypothetical protein [Natrinema ejinorense]